ncbi:MAG: LexA family transcriptional regulator [Campylobacterota bacterium]|nr:LexA family transcriptional regulator [Campylobacterota bacterium]
MQDFSKIVEEIKDIVSQEFPNKKIFDKDVAQILDISQMNLATMKKRNKIPYEELLNFCASRSIAINWILYGQSPESLIEPTNKFYMVKYFSDISASAGGGGEVEDESYESIMLEGNFVETLGGEKELKNIEAINVSGDSMEPTFSYGDIIFINRSKQDIGRGGVFTINTEHGLFVKRLLQRVDGTLDIVSDNKEYTTQNLHVNEVEVIGRVVGRFGSVD